MLERNDLYLNKSMKTLLLKSIILFKRSGLDDLAEKWERILKNYAKKQLINS